jgi:hypothetical protein
MSYMSSKTEHRFVTSTGEGLCRKGYLLQAAAGAAAAHSQASRTEEAAAAALAGAAVWRGARFGTRWVPAAPSISKTTIIHLQRLCHFAADRVPMPTICHLLGIQTIMISGSACAWTGIYLKVAATLNEDEYKGALQQPSLSTLTLQTRQ